MECKKLGIASVGIESNPMATFASSVKVDWSADPHVLLGYAEEVATSTLRIIESDRSYEQIGLPFAGEDRNGQSSMRSLAQNSRSSC